MNSVVIIGGLADRHRARVCEFVRRLNAPVYAEPLSGLREDPALAHLAVTAGERMLARAEFKAVVRIGNVPTLRFWRDLETNTIPVTHYSDLPFAGLTRGDVRPIEDLPDVTPETYADAFFDDDRWRANRLAAILDAEPPSELAMLRTLSRELPHGARVYLGNSLPIREWDLVATREDRGYVIEANRGANGIDGQLSTFFGWCSPAATNVAVLGDLTTVYDLNAPWVVPQLDADFTIVIVNNGGGRIFERVASIRRMPEGSRERLVDNAHSVGFDQWSAMWQIEPKVRELLPDLDATRRAWESYDATWR